MVDESQIWHTGDRSVAIATTTGTNCNEYKCKVPMNKKSKDGSEHRTEDLLLVEDSVDEQKENKIPGSNKSLVQL